MAWTITVASTDRTNYFSVADAAVSGERTMGERARLHLVCVDPDESYRPERNDTISVERDGAEMFSGVILRVSESSITKRGGRVVRVEAADWGVYLDYVLVSHHFVAGETLKQCATDLIAKAPAGFGLSIDAAWTSDGPMMPEMYFDSCTLRDALDTLRQHSQWLWSLNWSKALRYTDVANAPAAPWGISDVAPNHGTLVVSHDSTRYFNVAVVCAGAGNPTPYQDHWTQSGAETDYVTSYPAFSSPTQVHVAPPVGDAYWAEIGGGSDWSWSDESAQSTGTLTNGGAALAAGTVVTLPYDAKRTFWVEYAHPTESADPPTGVGRWVRRFDHPEISTVGAALSQATAYVNEGVADPRVVEFDTTKDGLDIGQVISINFTPRAINGSFVITGLSWGTIADAKHLRYRVTCLDKLEFYRTWVSRWRAASGSSGSTTVIGGSVVVPAAATSPILIPLASRRDAWWGGPGYVAGTWVPAVDAMRWRLSSTAFSGRAKTLRARVMGVSGNFGITVRLRNVTDDVVVATAAKVSSGDWTSEDWPAITPLSVALTDGDKDYEIEMSADANDVEFNVTGTLEAI